MNEMSVLQYNLLAKERGSIEVFVMDGTISRKEGDVRIKALQDKYFPQVAQNSGSLPPNHDIRMAEHLEKQQDIQKEKDRLKKQQKTFSIDFAEKMVKNRKNLWNFSSSDSVSQQPNAASSSETGSDVSQASQLSSQSQQEPQRTLASSTTFPYNIYSDPDSPLTHTNTSTPREKTSQAASFENMTYSDIPKPLCRRVWDSVCAFFSAIAKCFRNLLCCWSRQSESTLELDERPTPG